MFNLVCEVLRDSASSGILPPHLAAQELSPETTLIDLGIDSLGGMTLLSEIAGRLSVSMDAVEVGPATSLGEISERLARMLATRTV
jgi:hypothetical protein